MANLVERITYLAARRAEHRVMGALTAALERPDEARRCLSCAGEGYLVVDDSPCEESSCAACGGTGVREQTEEAGGDGA